MSAAYVQDFYREREGAAKKGLWELKWSLDDFRIPYCDHCFLSDANSTLAIKLGTFSSDLEVPSVLALLCCCISRADSM